MFSLSKIDMSVLGNKFNIQIYCYCNVFLNLDFQSERRHKPHPLEKKGAYWLSPEGGKN